MDMNCLTEKSSRRAKNLHIADNAWNELKKAPSLSAVRPYKSKAGSGSYGGLTAFVPTVRLRRS
jgi:hypothetical protein